MNHCIKTKRHRHIKDTTGRFHVTTQNTKAAILEYSKLTEVERNEGKVSDWLFLVF